VVCEAKRIWSNFKADTVIGPTQKKNVEVITLPRDTTYQPSC